jgi:hypothetical protein
MTARQALFLIPFAAIALTGCASTGSTSASPPAVASTIPGVTPAAASSSPAPQCSTHACVAQVMQQEAVGIVAANNSVVTGAKCKASTVRHNPGDTWTARCAITYSDNSTGHGLVTLLPDKGRIAFQPDGT